MAHATLLTVAITVCSWSFASGNEDRTTAEFREYAAKKLTGLSERKLDAIVTRVDANSDGVISEQEFKNRLQVFREVKSGPEPWFTSMKEARAESVRSGKPLLIFGRADWCVVCQRMEKDTLPNDRVQRGLQAYVTLKVDLTTGDGLDEVAEKPKINAIPAMIVESGGKEVTRILGDQGPVVLANWLEKHRGRDETKLRVLSYNIHHGQGVDGKLDLERIAKVIQSTNPDIVALQEVDRLAKRSMNQDQAKILAKLTKMDFVVFGPNIKLGEGDYGNAVLSRFPLKLRKNHKLPNVDNGEQRGVLDVDVATATGNVRLLATHFDHRKPAEEREASAKFVNELLKQSPDIPTLLAGDLNATPKSEPLQLLSKHWQTAAGDFATVPVKSPTRQIDFVLASGSGKAKVLEAKVVDERVASDHRPLLVVVSVANKQRSKSQAELEDDAAVPAKK